MGMGSIRMSSGVAHPVQAPSSAGRISVRMPTLAEGKPVQADEGSAFMSAAKQLNAWANRRADELASDAAQKAQSALSDISVKLYDRKELAAKNVADEWTAACKDELGKIAKEFDPATRKMFEERMAPWIAGRRENLLQHQHREVRRGLVNNLENDMTNRALTETDDIIANLNAQEECWRTLTGPVDPKSKEKFYATRLQQAMAVNTYFDERYDNAAAEGLYGAEEAESRRLKHRHDAAKTLLDASLDGGNADFAEYAINRLASGKGKSNLAAACGLSADELAGYRAAIQRVRDRKAADQVRAKAQVEQQAVDAGREKMITYLLDTQPPTNPEDAAAQQIKDATFFEALANDKSLPSSVRLQHAQSALVSRKNAQKIRNDISDAKKEQTTLEEKAKAKKLSYNQDLTYAYIKDAIDAGFFLKGVATDNGVMANGLIDEDYSPDKAIDLIQQKFNGGNLKPEQFHALLFSANKQKKAAADMTLDSGAQQFRQHVFSFMGNVSPSAIEYDKSIRSFVFNAQKTVSEKTQTGLKLKEDKNGDDTSRATYRDIVRAMNMTFDWKQKNGKSWEEATAYFDKLVDDDQIADRALKSAIDRNLDRVIEAEETLKANLQYDVPNAFIYKANNNE